MELLPTIPVYLVRDPSQMMGIAKPVFLSILIACALSACLSMKSKPPANIVQTIAPSGTLRAAINLGNPILANQNAQGQPYGVSVDLARELGNRLGLPVELVIFSAAGKVVEAVKAAQVDVAFVAIDPVRGADMGQTPAYLMIEGAYMVPIHSTIKTNDEVDRAGNRIVVGLGSAYDLYLSRELKAASLVRAPSSPAVLDFMMSQNLEVAAGVKQQLQADAKRIPGTRLLEGRFMVINQAMGLPKGRDAALTYLSTFVEEMKASGFVGQSLLRHRIEGATVAPAVNH
jgi:polar amino acid transport system substrate-binding protein